MSIVIRMSRQGRKNRPHFRVGVYDAHTRRDGPPIEHLGHYDPLEADEAEEGRARRRPHPVLALPGRPGVGHRPQLPEEGRDRDPHRAAARRWPAGEEPRGGPPA